MDLLKDFDGLQKVLSKESQIFSREDPEFPKHATRWSNYKAPQPGAIVNVASESDIVETVKWAISNNRKFLAQSGGHGFTTKWNIGEKDIVINLRMLRSVTINLEKGEAIISAGALVQEVLDAAFENKAHVVVGNCNSVGAIGGLLGGGLSRLQSLYSIGVDNFLSARMVTAQGTLIKVSPEENTDLWWGLRGAGQNFGIVTSLTVKAYPQVNGGQHWKSNVVFTPDKIKPLTVAVNNLNFEVGGMSIHYLFVAFPPTFQPAIALSLWYAGSEEEGRKAFESIYAVGPVVEQPGMTDYNKINTDVDYGCFKGGQKPSWSVGLKELDPEAVQTIWDLFTNFLQQYPEALQSVVMFECYSYGKAREVVDMDTAFPHRSINFHALCTILYPENKTDPVAEEFGNKFRKILQSKSSGKNSVYVGFAFGDETLEEIYGDKERLKRLQELKAKWDPDGHFSQFNPIK